MMNDTTYILVHGAWSGAWCWRDVGLELSSRGVQWTALDLPSSTHGAHANTFLADDAHEVIEVASFDGPVVLVGHSYGGAVITEAADRIANLERLVYIAALVPALGQSASEARQEVPVLTVLDEAIEVNGEFLRLNPDLAMKALYQDCTEEIATWAVSQLTTQTIASFRSPRSAFDVDVPSRYVMCTNDNALDPSLQIVMAERCREVTSLESGHSPFFSRTSTLCDLLLADAI
jgi:pimeloyl-ACP methyl ester carboxylesterase